LLPGAHIVRAFNAINYAKLSTDAHRQGELVGVPIAGDDLSKGILVSPSPPRLSGVTEPSIMPRSSS